ncbi:GDP-mannose 4,6-dehydratase [Rhodococcus sp. IEGM 1341]|uniref:GDP-mannose 4,6-dehydratase n=1 Tax=Rhodococcus sp. IEGM 1341 TaxID=3047090 RepID=UPI0024B6E77B|nr:GDP-mannose 4,6-dehydratase [Rhodococcus sp. IEGM 1341]MDI9926228.1 GDP-mannose 4,6-dehydratase [Rhodococcus sp. IEGM 1341]
MTQRALITGIGGQDGTILARRLNELDYSVVGTLQPGSATSDQPSNAKLVEADLRDSNVSRNVIMDAEPDVVFHFAGISSVGYSWDHPVETAEVNGNSAVALLDALLELQTSSGKERTFVNASSAEIFAGTTASPQNEQTPIAPLSPYGASKAFSHNMTQVYRAKGLKASNAIFYNHESTFRPTKFVTRKITAAAAAIARGKQSTLELGNLDARRDWGWAPDYVEATLLMATHDRGDDFVIATGEAHSVREFVDAAFRAAGIPDWQALVTSNDAFGRPADSAEMVGDASRAKDVLGWTPTKRFDDVVKAMVEHDLSLL